MDRAQIDIVHGSGKVCIAYAAKVCASGAKLVEMSWVQRYVSGEREKERDDGREIE